MKATASLSRRSTLLGSAALLSLLTTGTCRSFADSKLTPSEARAIAKDAYIFSYPLVLHYRTMYLQAVDRSAKEYVGGFGEYRHYGMSTPENKDIVTPNNNTPYSWAQVDLRAEPWVLTLPNTDGRYFTTQWDDMWGFVLDNPGTLLDGQDGGNFLLVSPNWEGPIPDGIKRVVRGETDFLGTLTRTGLNGLEDVPNLERTQQGYRLQPLSSFLGKPAPAAAPDIRWMPWMAGVEKSIDFFGYVNFLLPFTKPHPLDKPTLDRMALIGIAPGRPWDPATMDPVLKKAVEDGISDAEDLIKRTEAVTTDGAKFFGTRAKIGTDYLGRTMGVYMGIFGNVSEQAVYQTWPTDADGNPLNASNSRYTITFTPELVPQAKYFWSITMYSLPERLLVDNAIKRYSIGSQTPELEKAQDGSITIYVQKDSPGADKEGNWLPAPAAPFFAVLRVYGPGEAEQSGKWRAPQVIRER
jgi:hypothetical protein